MALSVLATLCVALTLALVRGQNAEVQSAVTCLNDWWSTNQKVLLESPKHKPLQQVMEHLSVQWLSDPWAQMGIESGIDGVGKDPKTADIGADGMKCIECIRQLGPRPKRCLQQQ